MATLDTIVIVVFLGASLLFGLLFSRHATGSMRLTGVVWSDLVQWIVAQIGAVLLAMYALREVGGIEGLLSGLERRLGSSEAVTRFLPAWGDAKRRLSNPVSSSIAASSVSLACNIEFCSDGPPIDETAARNSLLRLSSPSESRASTRTKRRGC
ncbi:MAG: hypothetical protein JRH20_30305 [Deltaproteobacteria bacterium]|nr:hypothetical protein [Deltaproteobacteria bacterium]